MQLDFKHYILNESRNYMAQKVGDILSASQELSDDAQNIGTRDLIRFSQQIVNQIRRILHSTWPREERKHLLKLQKIGVAIMRAIEEKDKLPETISGITSMLEKLVADLGVPIHKLASTDKSQPDDDKGTDKPEKAPPSPKNIDQAGPVPPPTGGTGQDLTAKPLGGSGSGPSFDAF